MEELIKDDVVKKQIKKNEDEAEKLLDDKDKLEEFLVKLEKKLTEIPVAGESLSMVPTMISLVRAYVKMEYTEPPYGTIVAIVAALIYFLSPIDLIPDAIPGIGYLDDAAVIAFCLKQVGDDLNAYKTWRDNNVVVNQ